MGRQEWRRKVRNGRWSVGSTAVDDEDVDDYKGGGAEAEEKERDSKRASESTGYGERLLMTASEADG